ncbi:C2 and GRAM domain-containing protein [Platanthera zijinensis]|uniref:C2 and GRAM domain-containing protein n=1 Tax=Platanthera zijinensis TaxID=2320716 RepID=A0AAP0B218_9ASPA
MRLYVYVLEGRGLPPEKPAGGAYVKLRVGNHKSRTRMVSGSRDFLWNEEFVFRVEESGEEEEIKMRVFYEAGYGAGAGGKQLVGRVRVPLSQIWDGEKQTLPPTWFSLQPGHSGRAGSKSDDSGNILLTALLYGRSDKNVSIQPPFANFLINSCGDQPTMTNHSPLTNTENSISESFAGHTHLEETPSRGEESSLHEEGYATSILKDCDSTEFSGELHRDDSIVDDLLSSSFEELIQILQSRDDAEMPEDLQGGVLLDQTYTVEPGVLNSLIFEPNSNFIRDLVEVEGTSHYEEGPWTWKTKDIPCLQRTVSYIKAATKFVKAVKAIDEQIYLKANGKNFAVLTSTKTPDVPYGDCFVVNLMYKITLVPQFSSSEESTESTRLVISWDIIFSRSTIMKSMIEGTARQGLKESYKTFSSVLGQHIIPATSSGVLDKNQLLAPLELVHQSDWELAAKYFFKFTVIFTILIWLYALLHILLSKSGNFCLEFNGLDLPDTLGELLVAGVLFFQGEHVFHMISYFAKARFQRGSDHGVKAQGDGWLLTVALIGGNNLPAAVLGNADPYVVFSCSGKTRTSSVQLQTVDPLWNEILEFDAMEEPPAVLDVEVFDFDGPFGLEFSLGHAEINFLKHSSEELADLWVSLEGEVAQASQSKLHLKIFLDNTKGVETIKEYLTKMEKEVGKKLTPRPPHKNMIFQKIFSLPPEEFLVEDFSCYLKRKLPLQGRIYVSARILGFYANLFGHKTKFFFLWEDVEDIQVLPSSFATVGTPALLIISRNVRGLDARHGSKSRDDEGRLKFQFQLFSSFSIASKTIKALWRAKTSNYEGEAKLLGDQLSRDGQNNYDDTESLSSSENTSSFSNAFSAEIPISMELIGEVFEGGELEKKIMEKVGCLNYSATEWKETKPDNHERHLRYKFSRHISVFGGEVTCTQRRTRTAGGRGWVINEVMSLHGIPFSDYFHVNLKYNLEALESMPPSCQVDVFICVTWLRRSKFRKRIAKNIFDKFAQRSKEVFDLCEKEILPGE